MSSPTPQTDTAGTAASSRLTLAMTADRLDAAVLLVSRAAAGLFLLLTAAILVHVVLRYAAGINLVWLEELHWQLYAFLATPPTAMFGSICCTPDSAGGPRL